jgi:hypothetical protein
MSSLMYTLVDEYQHFGGKTYYPSVQDMNTKFNHSCSLYSPFFRRNIPAPCSAYKHEVSKICGSPHIIKNSVNSFNIFANFFVGTDLNLFKLLCDTVFMLME